MRLPPNAHPATVHLYGGQADARWQEAWQERVYADVIRSTRRQLAKARRGLNYSSYAARVGRLERELEVLKQLAKNREGS